MKRTITISYSATRTYNLGDYENLKPTYSAKEEIELADEEEFTDIDYHEALTRLKGIIRGHLQEEAVRVKQAASGGKDYLTDRQQYEIFAFAKQRIKSGQAFDLNEYCRQKYKCSVFTLNRDQADELIKHLTQA